MQRQRNPRGNGDRLRAEVIEAAMRILDQNQLSELSLRMVAREAGVTPTSVYTHFPDAESMISEIGRECWRQLGEVMSNAIAALTKPTARDELGAKITAYIGYAMERPSRYQLLFAPEHAMSEESEGSPGLLQPAYRSILAGVKRIAADGGHLPATDPISATLVILSLAHGRIALAHLAPWRSGNSAQAVQSFVLETLNTILQTKSPAPKRQPAGKDERKPPKIPARLAKR